MSFSTRIYSKFITSGSITRESTGVEQQHAFWHAQLRGIIIRWSALIGMVTTSILAPQWLGGHEFGIAASLLTIPYLVQAFAEPVIASLSIRLNQSRSGRRRLCQVRDDTLVLCFMGIFFIGIYAWLVPTAQTPYPVFTCYLLYLYFLQAMFNTWLIAVSYAVQDHSALVWCYALSGIVQPVILYFTFNWGATGFLMMLCCSQFLVSLPFLYSSKIRHLGRQLLIPSLRKRCKLPYFSAVAPRFTMISLNSGCMLLGGLTLATEELSHFRIALSMLTVFSLVLPVSPQILESCLISNPHSEVKQQAKKLLLLIFLAACGIALCLGLLNSTIQNWLLHRTPEQSTFFLMFIGMPFYFLIQPLSSYLFATGLTEVQWKGSIGSSLLMLICSVTMGITAGFCVGSIAYPTLTYYFLRMRKTRS